MGRRIVAANPAALFPAHVGRLDAVPHGPRVLLAATVTAMDAFSRGQRRYRAQ
jgi:hypothetical protein